MAASNRDPISELFDIAAIEKNVARVESLVGDVQKQLLSIKPVDLAGGTNTLKEFNKQSQDYANTLQRISSANKEVLDSEKLAAAERKRIADERTQQAKIARAELQLQQAEIKKKALEEKQAAIEEKKAAAEAVAAGRERIIQLKAEQAEQEKLRAAAEQRASAEQQALSGTYNPGSGSKSTPSNQKLILTPQEKDVVILKSYESEIAKLSKEIDTARIAYKNGEISQSSWIRTLTRNNIEITQNKNNIATLTREMKLQQAVTDAERNSLSRAQALIALYTNEKKKLNLATTEGAKLNDNYNKAIAKTNEFILKNADAETVRTKTVGKYENAILSAGNKAFSFIRTAANILPGLGLSGVFLLLGQGIAFAAEKLGLFSSKLTDTKRQSELLNEVNAKRNEIAGQEIAKLNVLYTVATNNNLAIKERKKAVDELQNQFPDYFKNLKDEVILQGKAADAYDNAKAAIIELARAKAIESKLTELSVKELDILQRRYDTANKILLANQAIAIQSKKAANEAFDPKGIAASTGQQTQNLRLLQQELKNYQGELIKIREESASNKKDQDFLLSQVTTGITKKPGSGDLAKAKEATTELFSAEFEEIKRQLQRRANLYNEAANDENKTYDERIQALQDYLYTIDKLNRFQYQKDLADEQKKLAIQQANAAKATGTNKINQLKEVENTQQRIKDLENKLYNQRLDLADQFTKRRYDIFKSAEEQDAKARQAAYENQLRDAEIANNGIVSQLTRNFEEQIQSINNLQSSGRLSSKDADNKRLKAQEDFHLASLRNELRYAKEILAIQKAAGVDTLKQEEAIAKLASDIEASVTKFQSDSKKKELLSLEDYKKRKVDLYKQLYQEIQQTVFQFLDDGLKREEQNLDERKRLLDEDTQRRINNINQLGLTEVERVKQTAAVEKNAQFQTEQIEKRKRAIAVERAKYEKAASIANIIRSTAEAVVAALKVGPPQGIVLAALVGSIGALQLARAISTPLPKYFKGTDSAKQGLGVFGEIGRELVIPKQGQPYLSPAVATIHEFLGGEKIIPADMTAVLLNSLGRTPAMNNKNQVIPLTDLINAQNRTTKAVENMRLSVLVQNNTSIESQAWWIKAFKN